MFVADRITKSVPLAVGCRTFFFSHPYMTLRLVFPVDRCEAAICCPKENKRQYCICWEDINNRYRRGKAMGMQGPFYNKLFPAQLVFL